MESRNVIFLSYSRADAELRDLFVKHLRAASPESRGLELFVDKEIEAGDDWRQRIDEALDRAVLGVFLVSVDLVNSKFVKEYELPKLLSAKERGEADVGVLFAGPTEVDASAVTVERADGTKVQKRLGDYQSLAQGVNPDRTRSEISDLGVRNRLLKEAAKRAVELAARKLAANQRAKRGVAVSDVPRTAPSPAGGRARAARVGWGFGVLLVLAVLLGLQGSGVFDGWFATQASGEPPAAGGGASGEAGEDPNASGSSEGAEPVQPIDPGGREKPTVDPLLDMVPIEGGEMPGGDRAGERVEPFLISRYEITRGDWRALDLKVPEPDYWSEEDDDSLPANYLNWFDAVQFCNALSAREGLVPRYYEDEGLTTPWSRRIDGEEKHGETSIFMKDEVDGYRLPSELEWEFACRAGTATEFHWGPEEANAEEYAWFDKELDHGVRPVGKKRPNPWELHDMTGNVWEWCEDWYDQDRDGRALRGGSFDFPAPVLASSDRSRLWPSIRFQFIGFRVVRGSLPQHGEGR